MSFLFNARDHSRSGLAEAAAAAAWTRTRGKLGTPPRRGYDHESTASRASLTAATTTTSRGTGTVVGPRPLSYPEPVHRLAGRANHARDNGSNQRTRNQFRARRGAGGGGTTSHQLRQYAEATLGGGSLRKVVKLPEGEDESEWMAVNMVDFYNQVNLLYGAITEFCSPQSCPEMKATDEFEYLWQDSESGGEYRKPTKMPAPAYIELLMAWVQRNIDNEEVMPSRIGESLRGLSELCTPASIPEINSRLTGCTRS
jgi:hypothetical protein